MSSKQTKGSLHPAGGPHEGVVHRDFPGASRMSPAEVPDEFLNVASLGSTVPQDCVPSARRQWHQLLGYHFPPARMGHSDFPECSSYTFPWLDEQCKVVGQSRRIALSRL